MLEEWHDTTKISLNFVLFIILTLLIICTSIFLSIFVKNIRQHLLAFIPIYIATWILCTNLIGLNKEAISIFNPNPIMSIVANFLAFGIVVAWGFYKYRKIEDYRHYNNKTELLCYENKFPIISIGHEYGVDERIDIPEYIINRRRQDEKFIKQAENGFRSAQYFFDKGWGNNQIIIGARWLDLNDSSKIYLERNIKVGGEYKRFYVDMVTLKVVRLSDSQLIEDYNNGIKQDEEYNNKLIKRINARLNTVLSNKYEFDLICEYTYRN